MRIIHFFSLKCGRGTRSISGELSTTPEILRPGFLTRRETIKAAPMLCAKMKSGRFLFALPSKSSMSSCNSSTVAAALGPPEYPKPLRSIICTSKPFLTRKSANYILLAQRGLPTSNYVNISSRVLSKSMYNTDCCNGISFIDQSSIE